MMSEYVGLVKGKVHDRREMSEYYCGGCGYPVTDHDSYCRECGGRLHEGIDKSRWFELFGTPEKAARTIAGVACDDGGCEGCTLYGAECSYDSDMILGWLRGDA